MDLYRDARVFPYLLRGGLAVRSRADLAASRSGLAWRACRAGLVRVHRAVYLEGTGTPDLLDRARAALSACPPGTVLGYHTAAALLGFGVLDTDDIHVVIPAGAAVPQRRGILAHASVVPLRATVAARGLPCVAPARCAIDLARTVGRRDGLPVLDAALASLAVDRAGLRAELADHCGLRGVGQARELVELADGRAECRQESQLRLCLHDGGLRGFVPQLEVSAPGLPRFQLDLGDPERRVGAEYDGSSHLDRLRLRADRRRHNWLASHGWRMRYFTDVDLYQRPERIVGVLRVAQYQAIRGLHP